MGWKTTGVVLLLAGAVTGLVWQARRHDPARSLGNISYSLHCAACNTVTNLTTAELNRLIARGEATSPPNQMRRFKCGKCGKLDLVMDAGVPRAAR